MEKIKIERLDCVNIIEIQSIQDILSDKPKLLKQFKYILKIANQVLNKEKQELNIVTSSSEEDLVLELMSDCSEDD
jgi:hypothetical protein